MNYIMKTYWKLSQGNATPFIKVLLPYLQKDSQSKLEALNAIEYFSADAGFALPYLIKTLVLQKIENEQDRLFYMKTAALIIKLQT